MANHKKNRRSRSKKRNGAVGLLFLELIGVVAFAALLTLARTGREVAPIEPGNSFANSNLGVVQVDADRDNHRPRFSQVVSDLWEAGF